MQDVTYLSVGFPWWANVIHTALFLIYWIGGTVLLAKLSGRLDRKGTRICGLYAGPLVNFVAVLYFVLSFVGQLWLVDKPDRFGFDPYGWAYDAKGIVAKNEQKVVVEHQWFANTFLAKKVDPQDIKFGGQYSFQMTIREVEEIVHHDKRFTSKIPAVLFLKGDVNGKEVMVSVKFDKSIRIPTKGDLVEIFLNVEKDVFCNGHLWTENYKVL